MFSFFKKKPRTFKEVYPGAFIWEKPLALSPETCARLIDKFERDDRKKQGVTGSGMQLNQKRSTDLMISGLDDWADEVELIKTSVFTEMSEFFTRFPWLGKNITGDYGYQIQKTVPGEGYIYHYDTVVTYTQPRDLVIIWYLNDVKGGETEFYFQKKKIKPVTGKMIVFPPFWTHYHRGLSPEVGSKYICTTWMFNPRVLGM